MNVARDAAWSSLGTIDPYVVSHLINPAFIGGAQWPGLRQAFRKITRADGLAIVASDGLADPYLDDPAAGPGLGAEVYLCSTAFADAPMGDLSSLWQFETVYQVAQNIASMRFELGPELDRYGALSLSLPGSSAPAEWLDEEGTLGVLIGVPLEGVPVSIPVANGAVRFVGVIPLRPAELAYVLAEGADARSDVAARLTELPALAAASPNRPSVIGSVDSNANAEFAPDSGLVGMPAAHLWRVVERVLEDTSPFAPEADLVAGEVLRLRDTGQLSKALAGDLSSLIYQRGMHAAHTGDFQLTTSIRQLKDEIGHHKQAGFPDLQTDPVQVQARIADIANDIPLPSRELEVAQDQASLLPSVARLLAGGVAPGWKSLRFEVWSIGDVMSYELFTVRDGEEHRSIPGIAIYEPLNLLKTASCVPETGTWLSLTMRISSSGEIDVDYNFDAKPELDIDVSIDDYELELRRFPRATSFVPTWWQERIAQGDA
ncbi:hypothetical protein FDK12_11930 [Arthrobacter sp. NamB2]|uniref:hypothetical protein n=1 Tax=Arthrobacter sp. NamB2 TaxID=2576035 RepID=UPI0010C9860F|nr:hypothetical protein [Arthrobacter sp. NamB2]TKV27406.1 hypothetical protein FDK12_11930 [Arthrobacter sp. NamB2]